MSARQPLLYIHSPDSLVREDGYPYKAALFGPPVDGPFGLSFNLNVFYAESTLCSQNDEAFHDGPHILMVDRGGCTFVTKTRNAQGLGAAAVVIADNACLCSDTECMENYNDPICETTEPLLADDGSGADIVIPAVLMRRLDADGIKHALSDSLTVQMELPWDHTGSEPPNDNRVIHYELYSTPLDGATLEFLRAWQPIAKVLGPAARFTPHYYIYDGIRAGCRGSTSGENLCYNLCTNNGRYCAIDPDTDLDAGISGAQVVAESLARICIWKDYGEQDGIGEQWFQNVVDFEDRCSSAEQFVDPNCRRISNLASCVTPTSLWRCIKSSGDLQGDVQNDLLEEMIARQDAAGVVILPSIAVNGAFVSLDVQFVFRALCASYAGFAIPPVCLECSNCSNVSECASTGACRQSRVESNDDTNLKVSSRSDRKLQLVVGGLPTNAYDSLPVNNYDNALVPGGAMNEILFALAEDYEGVQMCGLDLGEAATRLGTALARYENGSVQAVDTPTDVLPEKCSNAETTLFLSALTNFHKCSGWDLHELIETLPSALFGTMLQCADLLLDETMIPSSRLSALTEKDLAQCTDVILGDNPIGRAIKSFILTPDTTLPCFDVLTNLPDCTLDEWPIPIAGPWLKKASCLTKNLAGEGVADYCRNELDVLNKCLNVGDEMSCDSVFQCNSARESFSLSLPKHLLGIPLPDACIRGYQMEEETVDSANSVVQRYETFVLACTHGSSAWSIQEASSSYNRDARSKAPLTGGSTATFLFGTLFGVSIAFVLALVVRKRDKRMNSTDSYYNAVELVEST